LLAARDNRAASLRRRPVYLFFGSIVMVLIAVSIATFAGSYLCDLIKTAGDPLLCLAFGRKALNTSFVVEMSDDNMPSGPILVLERQHQGQQHWSFFGIRHAAKYAGYGGCRKRKSPP
jgi:hypothetical protein